MAEEETRQDALLLARPSSESSEHAPQDVCDPEASPPTAFVWALTVTAGISGLLFGYDTGVISSTLVSVGLDLSNRPLGTLDKSLVTSCTSLLALIASPLAGLAVDKWGRKKAILAADALFVLGAGWQAVTSSVRGMVVGRSIVGLAIGGASLVAPLYISELSPSAHRGRLVTLSILFITLGQMIAYVVGWLLSTTAHGWRWMVAIGAFPAIAQFGLMLFLPESPRWLVQDGKTEESRQILRRVYGEGSNHVVERLLRALDLEIAREEELAGQQQTVLSPSKVGETWFDGLQSTFSDLFYEPSNRRALSIACLLQSLQQLCGFNSLLYFSATIFSLLSFRNPTLASLSIATTNFVFTLLALMLIDRIGRRRILLCSIPVMAVALLISAFAFSFLSLSHEQQNPAHDSSAANDTRYLRSAAAWPALVILLSTTLYTASYALGIGNVPWHQSELFPLSVRSLGSSIATSTNWACNFLVGITFLPMLDWWSPSGTFVVYGVVCALGWLAVYRIYPELAGVGLESDERRRAVGGASIFGHDSNGPREGEDA